MKRVRESNLPPSPSAASKEGGAAHTSTPVRLLFVLVPTIYEAVRKTLGIPVDKKMDDCQSLYTYVVGSADAKLDLEATLLKMVQAHSPSQSHPDCIGDVDMTSLPILLKFLPDHNSYLARLPNELTYESDGCDKFLTPFGAALRADFGTWDEDYLDGDDTYAFTEGPYKAVYFICYDPAVVDDVIEHEKLTEAEEVV